MAIDGGLRDRLEVGTKLLAKYKGVEHSAEVVASEDGKTRYRLADGREFKSPSAAGSAVIGGVACNGWRFWSVAGEEPSKTPAGERKGQTAAAQTPNAPAVKARPRCARCGKQFVGAVQLAHHEANADRLCVTA